MTRKIFRSILLVTLITLLAGLVLVSGVLYGYFGKMQRDRIKTELSVASTAVESDGLDYLKNVDAGQLRLTWVTADGSVIFDSAKNADKMENHKDREEIAKALKTGYGESSRYSSTLTEKTVYCAKRLSDGSVLRASVSLATVPTLLAGVLQPIAIVVIAAIILSFVLARRVSAKIVEPLEELDLDNPLQNNVYDELAPVLTHIERQQHQIGRQVKELESRRKEFNAVTENMNEGLVLLGKNSEILSINLAAKEFFKADDSCIGCDFLQIERELCFIDALKKAKDEGYAELQLGRDGREYRVGVSRIGKTQFSGLVILVFDITDKVFAERNRREFTANVSHELKTPLHSIMGSAELLKNGLVKPEDEQRFLGHIYSESSRLVSLIDDIIRLSQLDEGDELTAEPVDVLELCKTQAEQLFGVAKTSEITIDVNGESAEVCAPRKLLQEVFGNLLDNAVKYNKTGGSVSVTVKNDGDDVNVEVKDTGIGIADDQKERVFERFYRVDKSHSKQIGGTGLGLSIVKHAVQYMGGSILLLSELGVGTTVKVTLPKAAVIDKENTLQNKENAE